MSIKRSQPIDIKASSWSSLPPRPDTPRLNRYPLKAITNSQVLSSSTSESVKIMNQWDGYTPALTVNINRRREELVARLEEEEKRALKRLNRVRVEQSIVTNTPIHIDDPKRSPPPVQFYNVIYLNLRAFFLSFSNVTVDGRYRVYNVLGNELFPWHTKNEFEADIANGNYASGPGLACFISVENRNPIFVGDRATYMRHKDGGQYLPHGLCVGSKDRVIVFISYNHKDRTIKPLQVIVLVDALTKTPLAF